MLSLRLKVKGMSCTSCAKNIERNTRQIKSVKTSYVNFSTESAYFEFSRKEDERKIKQKIKELGFSYSESSLSSKTEEEEGEKGLKVAFLAFILALIIFTLSMDPLKKWPHPLINWYIQLILATPLWAFIGYKFQKALFLFFIKGQSNMNTLIGLGTSSAYLYSAFVVLFSDLSFSLGLAQKVYFEAVGFIISFVLLGQYLENKAKKKTKKALNSLVALSAKKACLIKSKTLQEVDVEKVKVNDIILVKPGGKFPVDGIIEKGFSVIDESMLTGESKPVKKSVGQKIYAGTINETNSLYYKATKVGENTFLAQMIEFVERAQSTKPKIERYADKISSFLTPLIMVLAFITFIVWFFILGQSHSAISNFIAVLVVACPCALGLATPTAVAIAITGASLKGLLIKGGEVLEKSAKIKNFVFDKTNTLTEGKASVVEFIGSQDPKFLEEIASLSALSEHPLSKAIHSYTKRNDFKLKQVETFEVQKSKGFIACFQSKKYLIGSKKLLEDHKIKINKNLVSKDNGIGTYVHVAVNKEHKALFIIKDKLRKEAQHLIEQLKNKGIKTHMLTGDNRDIAKDLACKLGIDEVKAEAMTLEKAQYIKNLQDKNQFVAMLGDGINDAPSLAQADLSLAMGSGTDVAIAASDVTLVHSQLSKVLDFLNLSQFTMKVIKQNLFFSFIYNFTLIPFASGLFTLFNGPTLTPSLASLAMALSSLCVVSNSLRIRKFI